MAKTVKPECPVCPSRFLGVFCDLEAGALEEFNQHKTNNTYKKGQIIFYEGNRAFGLYCVFSGKVKLYKTGIDGRQQIIRIASAGDILGYRSLFVDEPYSATAEALEDATICCIDKNAFFPMLAKNSDLSLNIIQKLSRELRHAEDLATSIAHKSVRERMAELLLMLKEVYGKQTKKGIVIGLELSREEMAEMIGITQETAIRLLSEFKKDGLIEIQERAITILDSKSLVETARLEI
ncbi:MAG: Crp/Fnr family transcriptional regulator [Deltaproteobacteria bacterium]|nr:Crp/Fnr family transcriptional regulator [Deltaproteobacteria bacterium]MBI4196932.1 Crp/Fnr family transcriptional regulator [Deltaproteobacteria bacterium]